MHSVHTIYQSYTSNLNLRAVAKLILQRVPGF